MTVERTFNFLCLTLYEHLTWRDHLNSDSSKISRAIGVLNFLKHTFSIHILKTIYNTLILSQLKYCLLSRGANSNMVFGLQKKAMRVILILRLILILFSKLYSCWSFKICTKLLNTTSNLIIEKIYTHSYFGFSLYIKTSFISSYSTECNIINCFMCTRNNT